MTYKKITVERKARDIRKELDEIYQKDKMEFSFRVYDGYLCFEMVPKLGSKLKERYPFYKYKELINVEDFMRPEGKDNICKSVNYILVLLKGARS